jgi:hypothetical protein
VIAQSINSEIDLHQERWRAADEEFESAGFDVGIRDAGVEHVEIMNIFQGPHKSLLTSPISFFPSISVTGYASRPGTGDALADLIDVIEISLLVETMVVAGPVAEGDELFYESLAHRRIERTSEAVIRSLRASRNLLGAVDSVTQPRGGIVNATWRRVVEEGEGQGSAYVMHGSRFQYALTRRASIPR